MVASQEFQLGMILRCGYTYYLLFDPLPAIFLSEFSSPPRAVCVQTQHVCLPCSLFHGPGLTETPCMVGMLFRRMQTLLQTSYLRKSFGSRGSDVTVTYYGKNMSLQMFGIGLVLVRGRQLIRLLPVT